MKNLLLGKLVYIFSNMNYCSKIYMLFLIDIYNVLNTKYYHIKKIIIK